MCGSNLDPTLEALGYIETLEHIEINSCCDITEAGLHDLFCLLRDYNTLKTIHLEGLRMVTDHLLQQLTKITGLREIVLIDVPNVLGNVIEEFVDNLESLGNLEIDTRQIDWHVMEESVQEKLDERKMK